jgi:hypothetical protein
MPPAEDRPASPPLFARPARDATAPRGDDTVDAAAEVRRLLAGRAAAEPVPGEGQLTVGRLLADVDAWAGPAGGAGR